MVGRYRMSLGIELAYLITLTVVGLLGVLIGDEVGRWIGIGALGLALVTAFATWQKGRPTSARSS